MRLRECKTFNYKNSDEYTVRKQNIECTYFEWQLNKALIMTDKNNTYYFFHLIRNMKSHAFVLLSTISIILLYYLYYYTISFT